MERRGAITVDDDRFARRAQPLIFVDVGSDLAAAIIGDPDARVARASPAISITEANKSAANFMSRRSGNLSRWTNRSGGLRDVYPETTSHSLGRFDQFSFVELSAAIRGVQ